MTRRPQCPTCGSRNPTSRRQRVLTTNRRRFRQGRMRPSHRWTVIPPRSYLHWVVVYDRAERRYYRFQAGSKNALPVAECADPWHVRTPHDEGAGLDRYDGAACTGPHPIPARSIDTVPVAERRRRTTAKVRTHRARQGKARR